MELIVAALSVFREGVTEALQCREPFLPGLLKLVDSFARFRRWVFRIHE